LAASTMAWFATSRSLRHFASACSYSVSNCSSTSALVIFSPYSIAYEYSIVYEYSV
jgi:hypothetical protein